VSTVDKAEEAVRKINRAATDDGVRPIVFSTLVVDELRDIVMGSEGLFLDFFAAFVGPLERELNVRSTHLAGRAHGMFDVAGYTARINATNFALANDDGTGQDYSHSDVILIGVSRSGKTPTCLYLALHYGVKAANSPLTEDDLSGDALPKRLQAHKRKLFGLTIDPIRLQQIRNERKPGSRYATLEQCRKEVALAEMLFRTEHLPNLSTTHTSIEEIASKVLAQFGIQRHMF
jgi:regulator of PEP synthase PpsR (kinase-PPPase family)